MRKLCAAKTSEEQVSIDISNNCCHDGLLPNLIEP